VKIIIEDSEQNELGTTDVLIEDSTIDFNNLPSPDGEEYTLEEYTRFQCGPYRENIGSSVVGTKQFPFTSSKIIGIQPVLTTPSETDSPIPYTISLSREEGDTDIMFTAFSLSIGDNGKKRIRSSTLLPILKTGRPWKIELKTRRQQGNNSSSHYTLECKHSAKPDRIHASFEDMCLHGVFLVVIPTNVGHEVGASPSNSWTPSLFDNFTGIKSFSGAQSGSSITSHGHRERDGGKRYVRHEGIELLPEGATIYYIASPFMLAPGQSLETEMPDAHGMMIPLQEILKKSLEASLNRIIILSSSGKIPALCPSDNSKSTNESMILQGYTVEDVWALLELDDKIPLIVKDGTIPESIGLQAPSVLYASTVYQKARSFLKERGEDLTFTRLEGTKITLGFSATDCLKKALAEQHLNSFDTARNRKKVLMTFIRIYSLYLTGKLPAPPPSANSQNDSLSTEMIKKTFQGMRR